MPTVANRDKLTTMKTYTTGEVFRLGLLKNNKGEPYKDKATVSRVIQGLKHELRDTPHGPAKCVSESEIEKHNKKMAAFFTKTTKK